MGADFSMDDLIKERNEMLIALDPGVFRAYMNKYNPGETDWDRMPDSQTLHSMHLSRLQVTTMPENLKEHSRRWLKARNLRTFEEGPP